MDNGMRWEDALRGRRSIRKLTCAPRVTSEDVRAALDDARWAPSAFNMQSTRMIVLWGEEHAALWAIVSDTLEAIVPAAAFGATRKKLEGFAAGCGTILFFQDRSIVQDMKAAFALYAESFDRFADEGDGMMQLAVWTALSTRGIAASLQHYNPLIDEAVARRFDVPAAWKLISQMPFGRADEEPEPAERMAVAEIARFVGDAGREAQP